MAGDYEIVKEDFVPMAKVKEMLKDIKEKNFEQKTAYDHAKKFSKIDTKEAEALMKELAGLEMRKLKPEQVIKIVDILPKDIEELKVVLMHSQIPFKDEELQPILDVVKKYVSKK